MSHWKSLVFILLAAIAVFGTQITLSDNRYTFGHPGIVDGLSVCLLYILAFTHLSMCGAMVAQRDTWTESEASIFRFMGIKTVFWSSEAVFFVFAGYGISADHLMLFVLMSITTVELDIRLFRRYILGVEDSRVFGVDEHPE